MMQRWYVALAVMMIILHAKCINQSYAQQDISSSSPAYQKAEAVAQVIDDMIRATRKHYTNMIMEKLKSDGRGASMTYKSDDGFVPLPAVFIRRIAHETAFQQQLTKQWKYDVALISRWNLNRLKGVRGGFNKRGWEALAKQQKDHLDTGKTLKELQWKPYIEVGKHRDQPVLQYLSADPASTTACVNCHNDWEKKQDIQERRKKQHIEVGKVFQQHELMGALSITIPLHTK